MMYSLVQGLVLLVEDGLVDLSDDVDEEAAVDALREGVPEQQAALREDRFFFVIREFYILFFKLLYINAWFTPANYLR